MRFSLYRISTLGTLLCLLGLGSCDLNKIDFTSGDSKNVENEAVSEAYFEDVTDISTTTVSVPAETKGGRESGRRILTILNDSRFACAAITLDIDSASTLQFPKGLITVDFQGGCADGRGNTRKGIIMIAYAGRRFLPGSSITTT